MLAAAGDESAWALRPVEEFAGDPREVIQAICRLGFEGIVSKQRGAPYRPGKRDTWLKTKCRPSAEVVIGGWRT